MSSRQYEERRKNQLPVPAHLDQLLNSEQLQTLHQMENFGWELTFVRRPLFAPVVAVLQHHDNKNIAVLLDDGELDMAPTIALRH